MYEDTSFYYNRPIYGTKMRSLDLLHMRVILFDRLRAF